jgi:Zn-finger nucleic acid-binding protein
MARAIKTRECPTHWKPLVARTVPVPGLDVKVDECPTCQGVFLDRGEVGRLTGNDQLNTYLTKHAGLDSDSARVCPACGMVMDMEDCDGVRVDVCLSCFGVWLDHGELDALKAKAPGAFDPANFTPEKQKEIRRAKEVRARDRKAWLRLFFYRLSGQDLLKGRR